MLRHLQFKIHHHGCWDTESSEKFENIITSNLSPFVVIKETPKGNVFQGLRKITGPEQDINNYIKFLQGREEMLDLKVVSRAPEKAIIFTKPLLVTSTYSTLMQNNATFLEPPKTTGGYEYLNVLVQEPRLMISLLNDLEEIGEVKVQKIGKYKGPETLFKITDKQKAALETAVAHGYYHYPRKTTVEELAKISGISRSTFQEHLRKAEAKLIPKYIGEW